MAKYLLLFFLVLLDLIKHNRTVFSNDTKNIEIHYLIINIKSYEYNLLFSPFLLFILPDPRPPFPFSLCFHFLRSSESRKQSRSQSGPSARALPQQVSFVI